MSEQSQAQSDLLALIEQAAAEGWKELDLAGRGLRELPAEIGRLTQLESLILGKFDRKKGRIVTNPLTALPPEIGQLTSLQSLDLSRTQISELPESITKLTSLQSLDLWNTKISELPQSIGQLTSLQSLNLSGTQISELPQSIGQLTSLQSLNLRSTQISELPESITQLTSLQSLNLWNTKISELPQSITQLTSLQSLDLSGTQISELPENIGQLTSLQSLDLSRTQISELPESITQLTSLQSLNLSSCRISQLPDWWQTWEAPEKVDLRGNPLPIPEALLGPREFHKNPGDLQTILNFYCQTQDSEAKPLYEAKLLIVGEGGAGKTTMAKKIQNPDYELRPLGSEDPEKSTEGIDIIQWQFDQPNGTPFRVNIWDFGGQEVYHATHQFFLTKRSLYALVADNRREQTNFYYWLNIVRLLGDNSPVFIVKNEVQNRQCEINEGQYRVEFENLKPSVCANFEDNRGLDEIKAAIQQHIATLPEIQQSWPYKWLKVRYALENDQSNYITQSEYFRLCQINGMPDKNEALQVSGLLHSLGICLHFQDDPALKHYFILSPTWVTNAVYKVTDNKKVQADLGRFSRDDLNNIWSDGEYAEMKDELLQLMQNFFICYPLRDLPGIYIAPSLLSVDRPPYNWDSEKNLVLRYEYQFMPKGMLTRLIVEMHRFIEPDESVPGLVWKNGVVLRSNSARAQVVEDYDQRKISIRVVGHQRKTLLDQIRYELAKIHESYPNLEYSELIPCNCSTCQDSTTPHAYPYEKLVEFMNNGRYDERCDKKPYETVDIRQLISDITQFVDTDADDARQPLGREARLKGIHSPIIIEQHQHYQEAPQNMAKFQQINHGGNNNQNDISGGQVNQGETVNATQNNYAADPQTPAEAAKEIQDLLIQLAKDNPLADEDDRVEYVKKQLPPTRLQRIVELTQTAGEAAVESLPGGKVVTAVLKKVREQEEVQRKARNPEA